MRAIALNISTYIQVTFAHLITIYVPRNIENMDFLKLIINFDENTLLFSRSCVVKSYRTYVYSIALKPQKMRGMLKDQEINIGRVSGPRPPTEIT